MMMLLPVVKPAFQMFPVILGELGYGNLVISKQVETAAGAGRWAKRNDLRHPEVQLHDGPGIRTTVFFKGCPLRCAWCANPGRRRGDPSSSCGTAGAPPAAVPGSLPGEGPFVSRRRGAGDCWKKCTQCLRCVEAARRSHLRYRPGATFGEILNELERDRAFYGSSGGGVTLSGGEPSCSPNSPSACWRSAGSGTAHGPGHVGICRSRRSAGVMEYADLVLYDIKTLDNKRHRSTPVSGTPSPRQCKARCRPVRTVPGPPRGGRERRRGGDPPDRGPGAGAGVEQISLLPYHRGDGQETANRSQNRRISRKAPTDGRVERLRRIVEAEGSPRHRALTGRRGRRLFEPYGAVFPGRGIGRQCRLPSRSSTTYVPEDLQAFPLSSALPRRDRSSTVPSSDDTVFPLLSPDLPDSHRVVRTLFRLPFPARS
jgi:pyruvate-formate lyase-activating enzyme